MDWRIKAVMHAALSRVPAGESINFLLQRYVTGSLPLGHKELGERVARARRHLDAVRRHRPGPVEAARCYEFGAGWDLATPLAMWALGVERQVLVDIRALARVDVINETIARFAAVPEPMARRPERRIASLAELETAYGISYRAPCDARATGIAAGSIDVITSSNTLEHIPPDDLDAILGECRRLLAPDGVMSFLIDYADHYAYFDKRITVYNFMRYSDRAWRRYNPSLHYQNRLRHADYLQRFAAHGFEVLEELPSSVDEADLAALRALPLDARFARYAPAELAVRDARVVLRKRAG